MKTCPSINDRLRDSDPSLTRLDISSTSLTNWHIADFLKAVRYDETVTTVHLSGVNLHDCLAENDLEELLHAVGSMKQLQELFVFKGNCTHLNEGLLSKCISSATTTNLKVLMLWGFSTLGENPLLAGAMRHHQSLERISLSLPCDLLYACLDVYAMGLAELETLQCLTIQCRGGKQEDPVISPEAIGILFSSKFIKSLYLENVGLLDDHVDVIVQELKTNERLTLLDLKSNMLTDDALYSFADLLPVNTTLKSIDLSGVMITEGGGKKIAAAMSQNSTITHLELEGVAERYADEFNVPVGHDGAVWMQTLQYQIRLNRAGSGQQNRKRFVESILSVSDQLDCIYHFVRRYPIHCDRHVIRKLRTAAPVIDQTLCEMTPEMSTYIQESLKAHLGDN